MKFPLRPSLKASFLHDEEIDWDALGTLEDSARYGAASPNADELDGVATKNYLEGLASEHDAPGKIGGEARKADGSSKIDSSHVDSSGRRRSSVTFDDLNDSLRSYGLGSHPGSLSDLGRRPSVSTLAASHSSKSRSPHELAAAVAKEVKDDFAKKLPSSLCKEFDRRDVVAPYSSKEIVLGPLLGKGEFSHVSEIKAFRPEPQLESKLTESGRDEEVQIRRNMKQRERYRDSKKACYAVKHLQPELVERRSRAEYAQAAADLAREAEFLSSLQHPNIVKLRGISYAGPRGFEMGPMGYFLLIDRLEETLVKRIRRWRKGRKGGLTSSWKEKMRKLALQNGGREGNGKSGKKADVKALIGEDQADVGLRIASAMVYLHERNIIFRDLKPDNVGFDVRGDVKLFDFGLATVVPDSSSNPYEDKFKMSGAGSPRYMAPEVLVNPPEKYNLKADVYTFGLVLWEIFSLEQPFSHIRRRDELVEYVVDQDGRPAIHDGWPEPIKEMLSDSFDPVIDRRPVVQHIYNVLRFHLINLRGGDETELSKSQITKRRSLDSFRKLRLDADGTAIDGGQPGQAGQSNSQEKPPRRRRVTVDMLRNKLRLSTKEEEESD